MTGQNQRDKRRILFVNDEMEMGGVARVLNTLMKNLDQQVYQIDLLVLHKTGTLLQDIPRFFDLCIIFIDDVRDKGSQREFQRQLRFHKAGFRLG